MDTLLSIELDSTVGFSLDCLSGTNFDTDLVTAVFTVLRVEEGNVVGKARCSLDLTPQEERVLLRYQKFSVQRNLGPPGSIHKFLMGQLVLLPALLSDRSDLLRGNLTLIVFFRCWGWSRPLGHSNIEPASG